LRNEWLITKCHQWYVCVIIVLIAVVSHIGISVYVFVMMAICSRRPLLLVIDLLLLLCMYIIVGTWIYLFCITIYYIYLKLKFVCLSYTTTHDKKWKNSYLFFHILFCHLSWNMAQRTKYDNQLFLNLLQIPI